MKFNNTYSQMFPGYPDAVSLQQAAAACLRLKSAAPIVSRS